MITLNHLVSTLLCLVLGVGCFWGEAHGGNIFAPYDSTPTVETFESTADFTERVIQSDHIWVIQLYAPWDDYEFECEECADAVPHVAESSFILRNIVKVGAVDAATPKQFGKGIASKYNLDGNTKYPIYLLFGHDKRKPKVVRGGDSLKRVRDIVKMSMDYIGTVVTQRAATVNGEEAGEEENSALFDMKDYEDSLTIVNSDNFDRTLSDLSTVFVLVFLAPFDPSSKRYIDHLAKKAHLFRNSGASIAVVDGMEEAKLYKMFGATFFPYTIILPASNDTDRPFEVYEGGQEWTDFVEEVIDVVDRRKDGTPPLPQLLSQQMLMDTCSTPETVVDPPTQNKNNKNKEENDVICILVAVPAMADTTEKERTKLLDIVQTVKRKMRGRPLQFVWYEATTQPVLETKFGLPPSVTRFPAAVALNIRRRHFTVMERSEKAPFSGKNLARFVNFVLQKRLDPTPFQTLPGVDPVKLWPEGKTSHTEL